MAPKYKVWIQVEYCDYENDQYINVGEPEELYCTEDEEKAFEYLNHVADRAHDIALTTLRKNNGN